MKPQNILIKDLIRKVHHELVESQKEREATGLDPLFIIDKLTIEANFIVTDDQQASGGIGIALLKADAKVNYRNEQIHKIMLELKGISHIDIKPGNRTSSGDDNGGIGSISPGKNEIPNSFINSEGVLPCVNVPVKA